MALLEIANRIIEAAEGTASDRLFSTRRLEDLQPFDR